METITQFQIDRMKQKIRLGESPKVPFSTEVSKNEFERHKNEAVKNIMLNVDNIGLKDENLYVTRKPTRPTNLAGSKSAEFVPYLLK